MQNNQNHRNNRLKRKYNFKISAVHSYFSEKLGYNINAVTIKKNEYKWVSRYKSSFFCYSTGCPFLLNKYL